MSRDFALLLEHLWNKTGEVEHGKAAVECGPEVPGGRSTPRRPRHGDYLHVLGLVLEAYENAADAVAFTRDMDNDPEREDTMTAALAWIRSESGWLIDVIGGVAKPTIEGWILALRGVPNTDEMSRPRALAHLAEHGIGARSTADDVDVVERQSFADR